MKPLLLLLHLLIAIASFADEDDAAVQKRGYGILQFSFHNGRGHIVTYNNGDKVDKEGGYYNALSLMAGFCTKKGISITAGVKHKIYFSNLTDYTPWDNTDLFAGAESSRIKYFFFSVPVMVDYKLTLLKDKLFWTIGAGGEMNRIYKQKTSENVPAFSQPLKDKFSNLFSFGVVGRTGALFSYTMHIDFFTNFYFEHNITSMYKHADNSFAPVKFLPYALSCEMGFNYKF